MKVNFIVLGEPCGKGRPRFAFTHTYTPAKTSAYEDLVVFEYRRQTKDFRFSQDDCLSITINAYMAYPKATPKWKILVENLIRPTKKPDWDNIGKIVTDALNKTAYHDDAQIVEGTVRKFYSDNPRIEVEIQRLQCFPYSISKKDFYQRKKAYDLL